MKRILFALLLMGSALGMNGQNEVSFEFSDGIYDAALKQKIEQQVMKLLTNINTAESYGQDVNFTGINIEQAAKTSITMIWENARFRTFDDDIVEHCLQMKANGRITGYQVRNIAVQMKPVSPESYTDDLNQEVCINFNRQGVITDFNMTMDLKQYSKLMREGQDLDDLDRRMQIIHFCEQFRTAYCQRDIKFMEDVFSDDALIITGRVRQHEKTAVQQIQRNKEVNLPQSSKTEYTIQNKQQYLNNLKGIFDRTNGGGGYLKVQFDDYRIVRHGAKPNYYGVTLIQHWDSKNKYGKTYSDVGVVFLVWDFTDEEHPKIHVRTWQNQEEFDMNPFSLKKFKLP